MLLLTLAATAQPGGKGSDHPRNVIFIVGDGMGPAQVYASIVAQGEGSAFLRFPYTGFSRTYSADKYTTDSGAGGSALMTGTKVPNYHIALTADGTKPNSFLYTAKTLLGKAAGFVVTSSVLDATPASTYAHVAYRKQYDSISLQMAQCPLDVMIGGDKDHFLPENRKDGTSPLDTLIQRGYSIAYSPAQLADLDGSRICGLLTDGNPDQAPKRGDMLQQGVRKALDVLGKAPEGFVLMIEGSQIDWANHNNDSSYLTAELADFEAMLHIGLDYARQDGNTLVVVTADHESGGLTLLDGDIQQGTNKMSFSTGGHTGVMVPVFAYGPGAQHFTGIHQNTYFAPTILRLLGE